MSGVSEALQRAVVEHYERTLALHGPTARGMDWKDEASQRLRFRMLCELCPLAGRSVHEVGAGAGHLCDYLRETASGARYSGSDLSAAMVTAARTRHPDVSFELRDLLRDPAPDRFDVVLCSGVFTVKAGNSDDAWWVFVREMVRRMFDMCRVGVAFNLMSDQVDFRAPELYYASPGTVLDFCRSELSRWVSLRHDYPLHEFTVYVYRNAPVSAG